MANNTFRERIRKYLDGDFDSFRSTLKDNYVKVYYPDTYKDFRESSPGMMILEMVSFIGDALSFQLDNKFKEIYSPQEEKNVYKFATRLGYQPRGPAASFGPAEFFSTIPAINSGSQIVPDLDYAPKLLRGTVIRAKNNQIYELADEIDFSKVDLNDSSQVRIHETDVNGNPTFFAFKISGSVSGGETKTIEIDVGNFQAFLKVSLPANENVLEIKSVVDSEGFNWYQVDYLPQATIFDGVKNTDSDSDIIPYILKLKYVPRRFVVEIDPTTNTTSLRFGSGNGNNSDEDLIPNLTDLSVPLIGKTNFSSFAIDPQNFLKTKTLGMVPSNTTLTVTYRVGGGQNSNASVGDLFAIVDPVYELRISNPDASKLSSMLNSLSVFNSKPIEGGDEGQTLTEVKLSAQAALASQNRVVTREDYITRILSMPARFGGVFRAQVKKNCANKNGVEVYILTKNAIGQVTAPTLNLKENIKTYLSKYKMITDGIDLLDGLIFNIAVHFKVVVKPNFNKTEVLITILNRLKDYFNINKWQLGQPIILSKLENVIDDVDGVLSAYELNIENKIGTIEGRSYSNNRINISENNKNGIIFCPENAIFEIKYPNLDLLGTAK